jgi:hypothetical protein
VNPETFGSLMVWQTLFAKYKGPEGGFDEAGLLQLVTDISISLGILIDKRTAQEHVKEQGDGGHGGRHGTRRARAV